MATRGLSQWMPPIELSLQSGVSLVASRARMSPLVAENRTPLTMRGDVPPVPSYQTRFRLGKLVVGFSSVKAEMPEPFATKTQVVPFCTHTAG